MSTKYKLAVLATLALAGTAQAKTQITCLTNAGHLSRQHAPLAELFNEMQDEIEVVYAAPAQNYSDTHLKLLRASATNTFSIGCTLRMAFIRSSEITSGAGPSGMTCPPTNPVPPP